MKHHIDSKHLGIKYPYDQCDKIANSIGCLRDHKFRKHPVTLFRCVRFVRKNSDVPQIYISICRGLIRRKEYSVTFVQSSILLSKHQQQRHSHDIKSYFYCEQCNYKSTRKSILKSHVKQKHESSFEYFKCDHCEYKAVRKDYLIKHKKSLHDKEKYPCDQCEYQATRMSYLQQHLLKKHQEL